MLTFDTYYHIYNHANGDDNLFREQKNYGFFLKKYHQHIAPIAETIAWCLMPNHFHLLVKIKSEEEILFNFSNASNSSKVPNFGRVGVQEAGNEKKMLPSNFISKQFANFFSSYSQSFNKIYNRRGSLFIKNFKRKEITDENYLRNLILYIHLNPIQHGFTRKVEEWKWTSYNSIKSLEEGLLMLLFGDWDNYIWRHGSRQSFIEEYEKLENELT